MSTATGDASENARVRCRAGIVCPLPVPLKSLLYYFLNSFFQEPPRANNNNKATPDLSADATEAFDGTETVVRIAGEDDPFPLWRLNGNKIDISCR